MNASSTAASVQARLAAIAVDDVASTAEQRTMVEYSIRDAVAVAVAGHAQQSVVVAMRNAAGSGSVGPAWLWGTHTQVDPVTAAFVNGTMVQALEFDDIASAPAAHMSSVIVPAVAALSDRIDTASAVDGIVHGLRAGSVLSGLISREAYRRGLQPTHTIGSVAAVCAIGYGLGLSEAVISDAIGLVSIQALGLRAHTGTTAKPMQSGLAAAAAVRCVQLAMDGASSGSDALDALMALFGITNDAIEAARAVTDVDPLTLSIKLYPTCGAAHSAIEAILAIREQWPDSPECSVTVSVRLPPRVPKAMHFTWPTNPDQARFSLTYCLAVAWEKGSVEPSDFTAEAVGRAAASGPPEWLTISGDETLDADGEQCHVTVTSENRTSDRSIEFRYGYPQRPLSVADIDAKARRCFDATYGAERAEELMAMLAGPGLVHRIGPATTPVQPRAIDHTISEMSTP